MTDPLAYLQAAHARAEQTAQAAGGDGWSVQQHSSETIAVYDSHGGSVVYDEGAPSVAQAVHIAANDPAAVLRRIRAERKILAEHANDGYGDCTRCAGDDGEVVVNDMSHPLRTNVPHPCATVRALAEAWGWQEEG